MGKEVFSLKNSHLGYKTAGSGGKFELAAFRI